MKKTMNNLLITQLPDDVETTGYRRRENNAYEFDTVYFSKSLNFTGTELEFYKAGYAYKYVQVDRFTRYCIYPGAL